MHKTLYTSESVATSVTTDVNTFNATKLNLMARITFTAGQSKSVFVIIKNISIINGFEAKYKTYELSPLEADSDNTGSVADVIDVESVSAIEITVINNNSTTVDLDLDVETSEMVLC